MSPFSASFHDRDGPRRADVGFRPELKPINAFEWLDGVPGGVVHLVVTKARPPGLQVTALPEGADRIDVAALRALETGASRVLLWHAAGKIAVGQPVAIAGASAPHRRIAQAAIDELLAGLKGVARRVDLLAAADPDGG